jgi:hypothetical protein
LWPIHLETSYHYFIFEPEIDFLLIIVVKKIPRSQTSLIMMKIKII